MAAPTTLTEAVVRQRLVDLGHTDPELHRTAAAFCVSLTQKNREETEHTGNEFMFQLSKLPREHITRLREWFSQVEAALCAELSRRTTLLNDEELSKLLTSLTVK